MNNGGQSEVKRDVSIVIPLFNQLDYTKLCVESLKANNDFISEIILVDNGSTDGTAEYLASCDGVRVIINETNRGCAGAWNQGVEAASSPWIAILNNDIIVSPGWLKGLRDFAAQEQIDIVSPSLREGEYNYDIAEYSREFVRCMASVKRMGTAQGACFMVHRRVFDAIGCFDENFKIGGSEDTDFYWRAMQAGFKLGATGRSFVHHFGSVTQDYIKKHVLKRCYGPEHRAYFREKWKLNWWDRFLIRQKFKFQEFYWRKTEKIRFGHSLKERLVGGKMYYY